jgi:hypothetical protein
MNINAWVCAVVVVLGTTLSCTSGTSPDVASSAGALSPTSGWNGCSGSFDTHESPTGAYFVTDFGCSSSPHFTDTSDNCCPSGVAQAAAVGLCNAGTTTAGCSDSVGTTSAIACERAVNWFSTGGSTFGLGTRLRLTRPDNGTSVVVFVIDNGPACYREKQFGGFALDISYPAIMALYGSEEGVSDRKTVNVTVVSASTPLGVAGATMPQLDASVDTGAMSHDSGHADAASSSHDAAPTSKDAGSTTHDATTPGNDAGPGDARVAQEAAAVDTGAAAPDASTATPCTTDGECNPGTDGSGQYCSGGHCVAGCNADWECPGVTTCVAMTCQ